jgi:hypothetical protein
MYMTFSVFIYDSSHPYTHPYTHTHTTTRVSNRGLVRKSRQGAGYEDLGISVYIYTVALIISLPNPVLYTHRRYMVLANPRDKTSAMDCRRTGWRPVPYVLG